MRFFLFYCFFCSFSFLFADASFHYIADLEFFYQERAESLLKALEKELGPSASVAISGGILGVHGASHQQTSELLIRLRTQERQQVLFEFILFTTDSVAPFSEGKFISLEERQKILASYPNKQILSRALAPSRRGIPLVWKTEKQWVKHKKDLSSGSSLQLAKLYFQGAEVELNTNTKEKTLRLQAKVKVNYLGEDKNSQETYSFQGSQSNDSQLIWYLPFQKKSPSLHFMILAKKVELPTFKPSNVNKGKKVPNQKIETKKLKIYKTWFSSKSSDKGLKELTKLYPAASTTEESTKQPEISSSGIEFFRKILSLQFPQAKISSVNQLMQVSGPPEIHRLISEALDLQDTYGSHQAYWEMEQFLVQEEQTSSLFQKILPLLSKSFLKKELKEFFGKLSRASWIAQRNLETQVCMNAHQTWGTKIREISFIKGINYQPKIFKVRTLSDSLDYGYVTGIRATLMANTKEYYLVYEYQRNLFEQPIPEHTINYGKGTQFKIQEPSLYRESYQIKTFIPIGKFQYYWGLPLNLSSGPKLETLTIFRVQ